MLSVSFLLPLILTFLLQLLFLLCVHFAGLPTSASGQNTTSRILLVTIQNPLYPITVDVLSQVFSPFETDPRGTVEKIVIFTKQAGLQALIQYSNNLAAAHAKNSLDGKNIYANCCTLVCWMDLALLVSHSDAQQIQFSNLSELTVRENSEKSRSVYFFSTQCNFLSTLVTLPIPLFLFLEPHLRSMANLLPHSK